MGGNGTCGEGGGDGGEPDAHAKLNLAMAAATGQHTHIHTILGTFTDKHRSCTTMGFPNASPPLPYATSNASEDAFAEEASRRLRDTCIRAPSAPPTLWPCAPAPPPPPSSNARWLAWYHPRGATPNAIASARAQDGAHTSCARATARATRALVRVGAS